MNILWILCGIISAVMHRNVEAVGNVTLFVLQLCIKFCLKLSTLLPEVLLPGNTNDIHFILQ